MRDKDDQPMSESGSGEMASREITAIPPSRFDPSHPSQARPRWLRAIFAGLGVLLTLAGLIGLILPYVPGVVFLILAAACFTRSSPRLEQWLLEHPRLGPPVVAWRTNGAIPRRAKLFACGGMAVSFAMLFVLGAPWIAILVVGMVIAGSMAFVLSRPDA
jgi:uncharacterized protein